MESGEGREVEIKLRLPDAETGRELLGRAGFSVSTPRFFESNVLYDTAGQDLRGQGKMLRVRQVADVSTLTFKGPDESDTHKVREEIELIISDGSRFATILGRIGLTPSFRYEKYRTEYSASSGAGHALLDETPIGVFLELEGPAEWIDQTASQLGFQTGDYVLANYGQLFIEAAGEEPGRPAQMVFAESGGRSC
jgi:adenylate cyclase class 2